MGIPKYSLNINSNCQSLSEHGNVDNLHRILTIAVKSSDKNKKNNGHNYEQQISKSQTETNNGDDDKRKYLLNIKNWLEHISRIIGHG